MGKAPAFQFYAADFLTDTSEWSIQEIGIYIRLLSSQWINETLPKDLKRLARIAQCEYSEINESWPVLKKKFKTDNNGRIYNQRLEDERKKQKDFREAKSKAGKKGAEVRYGKSYN